MQLRAEEYQQGKRKQEFQRGGQQNLEADTGGVLAECQRQQRGRASKQGGLPEVIEQRVTHRTSLF
jgi:hypothetical protein